MKKDAYLVAIVLMSIISTGYWVLYSINSYNTFHTYGDLAQFSYDMYYHIHYPLVVGGFQYLFFANHIAPDLLLLLPIYYFYQSPLTLLFAQAILVSFTAVVLYLVAADLTKNRAASLLIGAAFLLNPGTHAILLFDFHMEAFVPLFFILTFYYTIKTDRLKYAISLALLLGTIDIAPEIGISLGVALGLYALVNKKAWDKKTRKKIMMYCVATIMISLAVFFVYQRLISYINYLYVSGYYPTLPLLLRSIPYSSGVISAIIPTIKGGFAASMQIYNYPWRLLLTMLSIFAGLGVYFMFDPPFAVLFILPWLFMIFFISDIWFIKPWHQYYGLALGGIAAFNILSIKNMKVKVPNATQIALIGVAISVVLLVTSIPLFQTTTKFGFGGVREEMLLQVSPSTYNQIKDMDWAISTIPQNATVMAPDYIAGHMIDRRYVEYLSMGPIASSNSPGILEYNEWYEPDYILIDQGDEINPSQVSYTQAVEYYLQTNKSYALYDENGSAIVLKKI